MRIVKAYSHLNGLEYLQGHKPKMWEEIGQAVSSVDADSLVPKVSKEKGRRGTRLYAPRELNKALGTAFDKRGWKQERASYWIASDPDVARRVIHLPRDEQKRVIESYGLTPLLAHNQTDFVKGRVAMEIQFGKYSFVAFDLFVKHMAFYVSNMIGTL